MSATYPHGIPGDAPHPSKVTGLPVWESVEDGLRDHAYSDATDRDTEGSCFVRAEVPATADEWVPVPVGHEVRVRDDERRFTVAYLCDHCTVTIRGGVAEVVALYEWEVSP